MSDKKEKLGLCLGGGSARGYALIPIVQELIKNNIKPDVVSGCSIGALVGAYYCLHGEVDTLLEKMRNTTRRDFLKMIDINDPRESIIKGNKIKQFFIDEFFGDATFDDLKIPLTIIATDIESYTPKYFTEGKLVDAVVASSSIPGMVPPYKIDNSLYVDGGITKHIPYKTLFRDWDVDRAIVIDLVSGIRRHVDIDYDSSVGIFDNLFGSFYTLLRTAKIEDQYLDNVFAFVPRWINKKHGSAIKFYRVDENIKPGEDILEEKWGEFIKWVKE